MTHEAAALDMLPMLKAEARERQLSCLKKGNVPVHRCSNERGKSEAATIAAGLVEISRRIEEALGNRHGQRTDLGNALPKLTTPTGKSADIAAEAVGWSGEQYRRAKIKEKHA